MFGIEDIDSTLGRIEAHAITAKDSGDETSTQIDMVPCKTLADSNTG